MYGWGSKVDKMKLQGLHILPLKAEF